MRPVSSNTSHRGVWQSYPALLEAVLGAEEAVFDAELQACWALQITSILVAIGSEALLLRARYFGCVVGHCWNMFDRAGLWVLIVVEELFSL